jgi:membrane protease YdiL (CAAX protease family)
MEAGMTDARPFFQVTGLRFRLWPIVMAAVLMQLLLVPGREAARWLFVQGKPLWDGHVSVFLSLAILFQAALGFAAVAVMRRILPEADAHVRWPPGRTYAGLALAIGMAMGVIMLVADYWPVMLAGARPEQSYTTSPFDIGGYLVAMLITGLAEETIFRGVLVGMLAVLVPGRLRIGRLDLPVAAYLVALMFGLAHYQSFTVDPFYEAMAQQIYAFAWGLAYVWLMERSRSLLAPMIAHGVGDFVEVAIVIVWATALA